MNGNDRPGAGDRRVIDIRAARDGIAAKAVDTDPPHPLASVLAMMRERFAQLTDECRLLGVELDGHMRGMDEAAAAMATKAHLLVELEQAIAILSKCEGGSQ